MTPVQEMVATLFATEIIERAKSQLKSGTQIVSAEKFDMPFRLLKVNDKTVNLELMISRPISSPRKEAIGLVQNMVSYFKPIGVYEIDRGFFSNKVVITIFQEFEKDYGFLIANGLIKNTHEVKKMTMRENAVIAAFSQDAVIEARKMRDSFITVNGLRTEIIMANEGYPQMFLDDMYNIKGPIAAYFAQGHNSLNPTVDYKPLYDNLYSRQLLSAYKLK